MGETRLSPAFNLQPAKTRDGFYISCLTYLLPKLYLYTRSVIYSSTHKLSSIIYLVRQKSVRTSAIPERNFQPLQLDGIQQVKN